MEDARVWNHIRLSLNLNSWYSGKSHGWSSLVGYSPWGHKESDTTEWLQFHFSLSCIGEGNGSPLQYSCLENPMDGGAWWAAIYGVTQSRTGLRLFSSSSVSHCFETMLLPACQSLSMLLWLAGMLSFFALCMTGSSPSSELSLKATAREVFLNHCI